MIDIERQKAINGWLDSHCQTCAENLDRGTGFVNCQAECEVQKDVGIACIHYEEAHDIEPQENKKWVNLAEDLIPIMNEAESNETLEV